MMENNTKKALEALERLHNYCSELSATSSSTTRKGRVYDDYAEVKNYLFKLDSALDHACNELQLLVFGTNIHYDPEQWKNILLNWDAADGDIDAASAPSDDSDLSIAIGSRNGPIHVRRIKNRGRRHVATQKEA